MTRIILFVLLLISNIIIGQENINSKIKYLNTISTKIKYNPTVNPIYEYLINVYDSTAIIYNPSRSSINSINFTKINLETLKIDSFDIIIDTFLHKIEYSGISFFAFNNKFLVFNISGAKKTFIYNFESKKIVFDEKDTLNCFYTNCKINENFLLLYKVYEQPKEDCNLSYTYCKLISLNDFRTKYKTSFENSNSEYSYINDINYFELMNNGSIIFSGVVDPILKIIDPFTGNIKNYNLNIDTNWLQIDKKNVKQFFSKINPIYAKNRIMFLNPILDTTSRITNIIHLTDSLIVIKRVPKHNGRGEKSKFYYDFYKLDLIQNKLAPHKMNFISKRLSKTDTITKDNLSIDNRGLGSFGKKYFVSLFPHADIPYINASKADIDAKIENLSNDDYIFYLNIFKINVE